MVKAFIICSSSCCCSPFCTAELLSVVLKWHLVILLELYYLWPGFLILMVIETLDALLSMMPTDYNRYFLLRFFGTDGYCGSVVTFYVDWAIVLLILLPFWLNKNTCNFKCLSFYMHWKVPYTFCLFNLLIFMGFWL